MPNHAPTATEMGLKLDVGRESGRERERKIFGQIEWVVSRIHDEAMVARMSGVCVKGEKAWWYHDYGMNAKTGETEGHVASVVRLTELMLEVRERTGRDPLRIYEQMESFCQGHGLEKEWEGLKSRPDRQNLVIRAATLLPAMEHDMANLAEEIVWDRELVTKVKPYPGMKQEEVATNIKYAREEGMRYDGAEPVEARIYEDSVSILLGSLGLTAEEMKLVREMGAEMILKTKFVPPGWLEEGQKREESIIALAVADQVGQQVNPDAEGGAVGLLVELAERARRGDVMNSEDFNPADFLGGFVGWRFEELDKLWGQEPGMAMREFCEAIDEFRRMDNEALCKILRVPRDQWAEMARIESWQKFVEGKMAMQLAAAARFWPGQEKVRFDQAFAGWDDGKWKKAKQACDAYQEHYWEPDYGVKEYGRDLEKIGI